MKQYTIAEIVSAEFKEFAHRFEGAINFLEIQGKRLPPVSAMGIELNLSSPKRMDILVRFVRKLGELNLTNLGAFRTTNLTEEWTRIFNFFDAADSSDLVDVVWLEFDQPPMIDASVFVIPGIFFKVNNLQENVGFLFSSLELLNGSSITDELRKNIYYAVSQFPGNNREIDTGVFLGRGAAGKILRMSVVVSLDEFYKSFKYYSFEVPLQIVDLVTEVQGVIRKEVRIDFDISGNGIVFQGIEIKALYSRDLDGIDNWPKVFDLLVKKEICNEESLAIISEWKGQTSSIIGNEFVRHITSNADLKMKPTQYFRRLNHIKIVMKDDDIQIKGYLGEAFGGFE